MKVVLKVFICLLIGVSSLGADFKIVDVQKDQSLTRITLEGGMVWQYEGTDLFEPNGWLVGDQLEIAYRYFSGYLLKNKSYRGIVRAQLVNRGSAGVESQKIIAMHKREEVGSSTLTLDDNSHWYIGTWSGIWMANWKIGDPIIAFPQEYELGDATHLLLNLRPDLTWGNEVVRAEKLILGYQQDKPLQTVAFDENKREAELYSLSIAEISSVEPYSVELSNGLICTLNEPLDAKVGEPVTFEKFGWLYNKTNPKEASSKIHLPSFGGCFSIEAGDLTSEVSCFDFSKITPLFIISVNNSKITLSDQSLWFLDRVPKQWTIGTAMLVLPCEKDTFGDVGHLLFPVESPNHASSATLMR